MTQHDTDAQRKIVESVLTTTWTLFDDIEHYVDSADTQNRFERPDFSQRAKELVPDAADESEQTLQRATLAQVAQLVKTCTLCPLSETRTKAVPGEGLANARLMVIGEGPGADEDISGRPFVGKAGKYLDAWLKAINLSRDEQVFIANIVKCRPPQNRNPHTEEAAACIPYLKRQIALVKPDAILCVGKVAANYLLEREDALHTMRSTVYRYEGIPVVVTYHPAAVLRNLELRSPVWEDLKRVAQLIDMPISVAGR